MFTDINRYGGGHPQFKFKKPLPEFVIQEKGSTVIT